MMKGNFYTLRKLGDQLSQLNAAEVAADTEKSHGIRRSYAMHTPEDGAKTSVGCPEDAMCRYFCAQ